MLKTRIRRTVAGTERALDRLAAVDMAVEGPCDKNLRGLADIFSAKYPTPLREMAQDEMRWRNLSL